MLFAQLSSVTEGFLLAGALVLLTVVWLSRTAIWAPRAEEESETDRYPAEGASLTGVWKSSTETLSLEARGSSYSFCEQVRRSYSPRFCRQVSGRTEAEQQEHEELEAARQAVKEVEECLAHLGEVRKQEWDSSR
jgi:hypothetical protein